MDPVTITIVSALAAGAGELVLRSFGPVLRFL